MVAFAHECLRVIDQRESTKLYVGAGRTEQMNSTECISAQNRNRRKDEIDDR